jgi:predicted acyl esterase
VLIGLKRPHRIEMIPMRDGVKPYTVIILPRGAKDAPIVLTRTPNNARRPVSNTDPSMEALLQEADTEFVRFRIRNTRPK